MLKPEQIDILASQYVSGIYAEMEQEVINDIARRVQKTGRYTETAEIMARNMREEGFNTGEILSAVQKQLNSDPDYIKAVAEETKAYKKEIKELIKETEAQALADGNMLMANAGNMAFNEDMAMWEAHDVTLKPTSTLTQLQEAFTKQTADQLLNLTRTTGALQMSTGLLMNEYQHQMDLAVIKMAAGGFSYNQAVKDCVKNLAQHGLTVKYPSGRSYNLESAARMIIRTASGQLSGRICEMNMNKTGQSLVYVSAHAGSRPEHAVWQGKVYTYKGKASKKYPDFITSTGYGTVTGLQGVNCSHHFYPYWEGDVVPEFKEPEPVTINGKQYSYYDATQKQRRMEQGIRQTKRELEGLKAVGADQEDIQQMQAKLSKQASDYKTFSAQANLRAKTERLSIVATNQNSNGLPIIKYKDVATIKIKTSPEIQILNYEGDKLLNKNINGVGAFYNGITPESAKRVNKVIKQFNDTFEAEKLKSIIAPMPGSLYDSVAQQGAMVFDRKERALIINPRNCMTPELVKKGISEELEVIKNAIDNPDVLELYSNQEKKAIFRSMKSGRLRVSEDIDETVWHELGHAIAPDIFETEEWKIIKRDMHIYNSSISGYAMENEEEYLAESFCSFIKGENKCDPKLKKVFQNMMKKE